MAISNQQWQTSARIRRLATTRSRTRSAGTALRIGILTVILAFSQLSLGSFLESYPAKSITPQQVVKIVVNSLKDNDTSSDNGIATVYRFASSANKLSTGPLLRFTAMIKRGFPDMLNHISSRYDPMEIIGDRAVQAVWLMTPVGAEVGFAFQLSRQVDGEYSGMWMTDMVIPLGKGPGSGTRI